jgi:hypothetical protein
MTVSSTQGLRGLSSRLDTLERGDEVLRKKGWGREATVPVVI